MFSADTAPLRISNAFSKLLRLFPTILAFGKRIGDEVFQHMEPRVANSKDKLRIDAPQLRTRRLRVDQEASAQLFHDRRDDLEGFWDWC